VKILKASLMASYLVVALFVLSSCGEKKVDPPAPKTPVAPSDITATPGPSYVTVTWKDNSDNETGFALYRDGGSTLQAQGVTKIKDLPANTTTFIDTEVNLETDYTYSVVATGTEGNSEQISAASPIKIAQGVDLMVGTLNRRNKNDNGTIMIVYYLFPKTVLGDETTPMSVKITGPNGWNNDQPYTFDIKAGGFSRTNGFSFTSDYDIDAVKGSYQVELTVGDKVYKANAELKDASFKFPSATNIQITSSVKTSVTVTWDATPSAKSYWVSLWRGNYEELIGNFERTTNTTFTFQGLNLDDGLYQVEIAPVNSNIRVAFVTGRRLPRSSSHGTHSLKLRTA
jgi:hypothetical protein